MNHITIIIDSLLNENFGYFHAHTKQYQKNFPFPITVNKLNPDDFQFDKLSVLLLADEELGAFLSAKTKQTNLLGITYGSPNYQEFSKYISLKADSDINTSIIDLFNIGTQRHLINSSVQNEFFNRYFEEYSLGDINHDVSIVEPCFRDSQISILDINLIKSPNIQSKSHLNPCGIDPEQFVQLCRYAGISPKTEQLIITGYDPEKLKHSKLDQILLAQCIYYFSEGVLARSIDEYNDEKNRVYVFDVEKLNKHFNFIKHYKTGRWWIKWEEESIDVIISAHHNDYSEMKKGHIPDRLLSAFYRHR